MPRKRLTQIFPFLLPLRKWQRKKFFYLKMRLDRNKYSKTRRDDLLPHTVFETSSLMLNENSGYDMKYQHNKVFNLQLAAKTVDRIVIAPGETFSFWQLVRYADKHTPYRDGLNFVDGKIVGDYGGGLCQLSNTLFWMFLHTPLTVTERHGHTTESFPSTDSHPLGTDATINEGWLDLKVRNDTANTFQIIITFDEKYMHVQVLSLEQVTTDYTVYNSTVTYYRKGGRVYQTATVCRTEEDRLTHQKIERELYTNLCGIAYDLPQGTLIEERG